MEFFNKPERWWSREIYIYLPSKLAQAVMLMICIWEVFGLNLGLVSTILTDILRGFTQSFRATAGIVS
jgi:hypothetical protein